MINDIKVGYFLAYNYLKRNSIGVNILVVSIMTLTFVNLLFTIGILVGLVEGSSKAYREQYSGDVFISSKIDRDHIERTDFVESVLRGYPGVVNLTTRYLENGTVQADFKNIDSKNKVKDIVGTEIAGINPQTELEAMNLKPFLIEGGFINSKDHGKIVLGADLLEKYSPVNIGAFDTLANLNAGDEVLITINGVSQEFEIKGIIDSKSGAVGRRVFMLDDELIKIASRDNLNADEIAVNIQNEITPQEMKENLINSGLDKFALVRTGEESLGEFFENLKGTFSVLGNVIGAISLLVGAVTIFIVIFITVLTRKKFIGILEGIGISKRSIITSYIILSIFYSLSGIIIGSLLVLYLLVPFFANNPIDFPFSDGILVADYAGIALRASILLVVTIIAGFIPTYYIVRKDPLESILGR